MPMITNSRPPALTVKQSGDSLVFRGLSFRAAFDTGIGTLTTIDYGFGQLLEGPLQPVIRYSGRTPALRLSRVLRNVAHGCHCLTFFYKGGGIAGFLICHFQIWPDGEITIEAAVRTRVDLVAFDFWDGEEKDQPLPAGPIHKINACIRRP